MRCNLARDGHIGHCGWVGWYTKEAEEFICLMGRDFNRDKGGNSTAPCLNEMQNIERSKMINP